MPFAHTEMVNLDYAASTPLRLSAIDAQREYDNGPLAGVNPNSLHSLGRAAAQKLEGCRRSLAQTLGRSVRPSEVIFTGGGTEANAMALLGIAEGARQSNKQRTRVLISAIEHDSMLDNIPLLHAAGFTTDLILPNSHGVIEAKTLASMMDDSVALVSVMLANNETGAVQPIADLAACAHEHGAYFHTDAIQGFLHVPFDIDSLGIDALSLAGHKIGGPVGVGALYLKTRTPFRPRIFGGGQEAGRRPGTQDLRQIIALTAAASELYPNVAHDFTRLTELSNVLYDRLVKHPLIHATIGEYRKVDHLPGIVSIAVDNFDSEDLILQLDARGFEVSAGSACTSGNQDASHVLLAMGIPRNRALGSLRISFDDRIDPASLDRFCSCLFEIIGEPHAGC